MKLWDIFKKKKEKPQKPQKLSQAELQDWLFNKQVEMSNKEQHFFDEVKEKTVKLIQELTDEITVLNQIDFDKKKEREKIKAIVQENFRNYIINLERLIQKIQAIENSSNIISQINKMFHDFDKKSKPNYEKATYLIGKEMAATKESIRGFFKELEKVIKNNKKYIEDSQIIESIKKDIDKYKGTIKINSQIVEEIEEQAQKINEISASLQEKEKEKEKIKESKEYLEKEEEIKKLKIKKEELEQGILKLKQLINFKSLANICHKNEKEMSLIKEYKENFKQAFNKAGGEDLAHLLKGSNQHTEEILNLIQKINSTKQELSSTQIEHTNLNIINDSITKLKYELEQTKSVKETKKKAQNKFEENKDNVLKALKEKLSKVNIELN